MQYCRSIDIGNSLSLLKAPVARVIAETFSNMVNLGLRVAMSNQICRWGLRRAYKRPWIKKWTIEYWILDVTLL